MGGLSLVPRKGTIQPGDSEFANLILKLADHTDSEKVVQIIIHSNDPQRSKLKLLARAICPAPFQIAPKQINETFYELSQLQNAKYQIEISPAKDELGFDDAMGELQISSDNKLLKWTKRYCNISSVNYLCGGVVLVI